MTRTVIGVAVAVAVAGGIVGILWALDWPRFLFLGYVATKIGIKVGVAAFAGALALIAWWRGRRAKRQEEQPPPAEAPTD